MVEQANILLHNDHHAPATGRRFVAIVASDMRPAEADRIRLATSELVTNAVRTSADAIEVALVMQPTSVRLEVRPAGDLGRRESSGTASDGFGVRIVEAVCDRWGVAEDGAAVWCEVGRVPGGAA
jgi:anti-sigma regulatory factor (Ser/Thr protein kinase)